MTRSANRRISLKLCRSNLAKKANIIQILLCTKALYGLHRWDVIIIKIFLTWISAMSLFLYAQDSYMQEAERLLSCQFAPISVYSVDKHSDLSLVFLN